MVPQSSNAVAFPPRYFFFFSAFCAHINSRVSYIFHAKAFVRKFLVTFQNSQFELVFKTQDIRHEINIHHFG